MNFFKIHSRKGSKLKIKKKKKQKGGKKEFLGRKQLKVT